jgi:hypothetical protein
MADPIEVPLSEAELIFMEIHGAERGMLELIRKCPECEGYILVTDNSCWLDLKPVTGDDPCAMGVMDLGGMKLAVGGAVDGGSKHELHEHQPEEKD